MKRFGKNNPTGPGVPYVSAMVEKQGLRRLHEAVAALKENLANAEAELRNGETQEAERRAKAISALVKAARDVADLEALARAQPPEENEHELRAELRSRLRRLVEAQRLGAPDATLERLADEVAAR
ncbi:MAG: hypothetical protein NVV62_19505 [Terricaulis sp.]|nr:hypothetical protein [Terricaulis sp.]